MPADIADRVYLASLDSEDLAAAFGDGYETATEPPAVSGLLRSLADTHAWATRDTDVLASLDRGDYVLFHRDWGLRAVGQVWSTTADSDEVARHTAVDDPAGEWGVVTLTNVQPALDTVSLLSLDAGDAQRDRSLYRIEDAVARDLRSRFTTPARLIEETVANPLAFDVPPGGTPPDRRPDPPENGRDTAVSTPETAVSAHLDALDGVRTTAWRVLALGAFLVAATLAVVQQYRPADGDPFSLTLPVSAGVVAVGVGGALAVGVVLHGALKPRPGLGRFTREQTGATRRAGATESGSDASAHLANATRAYCAHLAHLTRRLGAVTAVAAVGVVVGAVYLAYGLGVQVSPAVRPLSLVALAVFPALAVAATLYAFRRRVVDAVGDLPDLGAGVPSPARSLADRADAAKRRVSEVASRIK
ncbi:hypothetical protein [Halobacterium litoreum]|uniref:Uncharacterized protein n=1 Tax=Halobacterium litoreum TaxID=2039234 RepID=A0ABD5NDL3_9EURY|nr:hypothetical protein [Halobacterium litoreum]UHH14172.1 hypothetical protein LT972_04020 [Halobacterium litoreum]